MKILILSLTLLSCDKFETQRVCNKTNQAEWLLKCYDSLSNPSNPMNAYEAKQITTECRYQSIELFCREIIND